MATQKPTTFHVALDTLKLSAAQKANLSKTINAAALHELARLDLADGLQGRIPKEWRGMWIDRFKAGTNFTTPDTSPAIPESIENATVASVVLDGIKLTGAQRTSLESAIRTAALGELGRIGPREGLGVRYPKEWTGIWIGPYGTTLK